MHPAASRLTFIASSCQDESNGAVFLLLVLRVWREGLGAMVEGDGVFVAGANHGAGVPHGRSWGLVLDLPIIRHLQIGCSRPFLCTREAKVKDRNTNSSYRRTCFKSVSSSLLIWHEQKQYQLLTNYAVFIFCQKAHNNISYHCISRLYSSAHVVAFPSKLKLFTRRFVVSHKEKTKNHEHWD